MSSCTPRAMSLAAILAGLGAFGVRPACASIKVNTSPQHEKFLQLLISRQDHTILQHLQTKKRSLDIRLHQLEHEFSKCYKLEARFRGGETQTRKRDEDVTKKLANPPRSAKYNQLVNFRKG